MWKQLSSVSSIGNTRFPHCFLDGWPHERFHCLTVCFVSGRDQSDMEDVSYLFSSCGCTAPYSSCTTP